jgi:predicted nucleotidyltransferase component of viral defense system
MGTDSCFRYHGAQKMKGVYLLPEDERENLFRVAGERLNISFDIIEKDYWVVWTLERLFALEDLKTHLTFKGGTSLSKVYGIIDRFSEDVDLSIERDFLGFNESNDPEKAPSKKKQRSVLANLSKACSDYVQNKMLSDLRAEIAEKIGTTNGWQVVIDGEDPDGQTLFFEYPSITSQGSYIRPFVKIEMGARSEHWPVSHHKIQSYVKEALKEKIHEDEIVIRVLNAERTFWEKATILHQYAHLPKDKKTPSRISRHYYDFFRLLNSSVKEKALSDLSLLERVAAHKNIYFASAWASYGTACKGNLKLSPPTRIHEDLEKDYALMASMFFREIPSWEQILKTIEDFDREFNVN